MLTIVKMVAWGQRLNRHILVKRVASQQGPRQGRLVETLTSPYESLERGRSGYRFAIIDITPSCPTIDRSDRSAQDPFLLDTRMVLVIGREGEMRPILREMHAARECYHLRVRLSVSRGAVL
jgi:hypothetical protein